MKKFIIISCLLSLTWLPASAQLPVIGSPTITIEQQLENITENNQDQETEDDSYLQQLQQWQKNPVNINFAEINFFQELRLLTPIQIQNFLAYRSVLGKLISIYELQAIPGWDIATIQKVRPYIAVLYEPDNLQAIGKRFRNGTNQLLLRVTRQIEKSVGYLLDSSIAKNYYPGSPQRLFLRYKYNYKNLLQFGLVAEKDAGEEFFKGSQKKGFDFYSAHLFLRNTGFIKSLALGDFTVNMGQGLTQWMSLAFKKGPDIFSIKRQSLVLRPYNSSGEINFHRGTGITIGKNNWQSTVFASFRKVDANLKTDTSANQDDFITSLQTSGLHRTNSELAGKGSQDQFAMGGNFSYRFNRLQVGLNTIHFKFKYPLVKANDPYNLFALTGRSFGNYSMDYSYTYKNMHFFGEAALTDKKNPAFVNGLLVSVARNADMSFLYRNISRRYQSLYANAFTENTYPNNEKGIFSSITVHPFFSWTITAYADLYKFPWLKFRVNNPGYAKEYMVQVTYRPNRQFEMYTRFKTESKWVNSNPGLQIITPVIARKGNNWRTHFSYKVNSFFTLRTRVEIIWLDKGFAKEQGFLIYTDLLYKPAMKPLSCNLRIQYFETDGYDSRLYAYENDLLYTYTVPVFYDKGYRYYFNIHYDPLKKISIWVKWSRSLYPEKTTIGSGLDLIKSGHRSEAKVQLSYLF